MKQHPIACCFINISMTQSRGSLLTHKHTKHMSPHLGCSFINCMCICKKRERECLGTVVKSLNPNQMSPYKRKIRDQYSMAN